MTAGFASGLAAVGHQLGHALLVPIRPRFAERLVAISVDHFVLHDARPRNRVDRRADASLSPGPGELADRCAPNPSHPDASQRMRQGRIGPVLQVRDHVAGDLTAEFAFPVLRGALQSRLHTFQRLLGVRTRQVRVQDEARGAQDDPRSLSDGCRRSRRFTRLDRDRVPCHEEARHQRDDAHRNTPPPATLSAPEPEGVALESYSSAAFTES